MSGCACSFPVFFCSPTPVTCARGPEKAHFRSLCWRPSFLWPIRPILLAFLVVVGGHFVVDTLNLSRHKLSSPAPDYCCLELRGRLRLIWRRHTFVTLVLILIIFSSSTTWWSYRNFRMFHSFIPIKSNLWFDYYQANELDDDGLVTLGTLYTYNPSHVNSVQKEFIAKGEGEFTRDYRRKSSAAFRTHAGRTAGNIMRARRQRVDLHA